MYTIHFSALETTLLPYYLFIVYSAIVLWIRSVREGVEIAPEPEQTDFVLSIPAASILSPVTRKRQSKSVSELIMGEWHQTSTDPISHLQTPSAASPNS